MTGRLTLGLYNCYDAKQWVDIMRITLARAGPVALAFDCDLVTFGFPYAQARLRGAIKSAQGLDSPTDVAEFVAQSTTIGEGGEYLLQLAEERRFHILPFPDENGFPARFGTVTPTTPSPDATKATTPLDIAKSLADGEDHLLLFGLGPRGLPAQILEPSPNHLELTGRGISMETATALGALPAIVATHLQHIRGLA